MKKIYHLSACSTCQKILKELAPDATVILQDIKEQNISDIKFDKESQSTVFEFITDFFKSAYEENNFFGGKKEKDVFINYLNYSYNFKQKILLQLKNICK